MKVKFVPQNVECEIRPGQSVLHVAQDNNIHIKSVCRGQPSCAECRVRVVDGEYNVIPPSSAELSLIGTAWFVDHRRLSCQLRCFGDITVDLTEQVERENSGKKPRGRYNKDEMQESRAVLGNLVMSDEDKKSGALIEDEDLTDPTIRPGALESARAEQAPADDREPEGPDDGEDDGDEDDDEDHPTGQNRAGSAPGPGGPNPGGGKKRRRSRTSRDAQDLGTASSC